LVDLNQQLQHARSATLIRMEPGVQSSEQTLTLSNGSCRDSAWLLVEILRHLGLAARFVSGYLIQLKPDMKPLEGQPGPGQDFTDLHAWTEVYLPGAGWIGLDPTSGLLAGEGHIPLAATPEPSSAAPISGAVDACEVTFTHEMSVTRIYEDPRVTLPYTDAQWQRIQALGAASIKTFAPATCASPWAASRPSSPSTTWTARSGTPPRWARKSALAERLLDRLRKRFAPGGLLHYGQGKWYPGEPLPRWALTCYWRADGVPLWHDRALLAQEQFTRKRLWSAGSAAFRGDAGAALGTRSRVRESGVRRSRLLFAERAPTAGQCRSGGQPAERCGERERLRKVFERGLDTPVGFVLPVQRVPG
jgi:hypothetical protein